MSRHLRLVALALAVAWVPSAAAQSSESDLLRQLDSLRPLLNEARVAADAVRERRRLEQARAEVTSLDTVHVGPLRVLALPDQSDLVADLLSEVWTESFGNVVESPALDRWMLSFQWRARIQRIGLGPEPESGSRLVRHIAVNRVWQPSREGAKDRIREAIAVVLTEDFAGDSPIRTWLTARGHPAAADVYRELAGTPSGANRACLAGDARACWAALGLEPSAAGARLTEWFAPEALARMVVEASNTPGSSLDRDDPATRGCTEESDFDACVRILSQDVEWTTGVPLSGRAFAHVFWLAVRLGGEEAWERALERRDASPPEFLTYVSGRSAEDLATVWRDTVVASRPDVHAGLDDTRWTVLFWFLVLAAFAMRSTRWRLA